MICLNLGKYWCARQTSAPSCVGIRLNRLEKWDLGEKKEKKKEGV